MPAYASRIVLEIDLVEGSLLGRAITSDGGAHEFTGWVGLFSTLQRLLSGDDPATRDPEPTVG